MSADNWAVCPQCQVISEKRVAKADLELTEKYGKVPPAEYLEAMRVLGEMRQALENPQETLREDYGVGIQGGEFDVSYRASCSDCGFCFKFKETRAVPVEAKEFAPPEDKTNV